MTKTKDFDLTPLGLKLVLAAGASALAMGTAAAWAQDDADDEIELIEDRDDIETTEDEIVVTGSRLRRSTFNSISPLQVITAQDSLDVGLVDASSILQRSTAAAGTQIDSSFQGFVLDNGPGQETISLRGLGASRTLVLINGRRFAPAGVEGAPTQPSINLLPASLVDQYDILLDGASSVYGSDAVAGVVNVVLKKDFDGLELFGFGDLPVDGAGSDFTVSGAWGKNNDRGFFGIGAEYRYRDAVKLGDRPFTGGCETNYEITESGQIRTEDLRTRFEAERDTQGLVTAPTGSCIAGAFTNRIFDAGPDPRLAGDPAFGSAYYTPGRGNILPNYSDTGLFRVPIDQDQDGIVDVYFPDFSNVSRDQNRDLVNQQEQFSLLGYGEYTFDGEMNFTPYFEAMYVNNDLEAFGNQGSFSAQVPGTNPFNPCNPNAEGGVDCGLAEDDLLRSPEYLRLFQAFYNGGPGSANCFGLPAEACTPASFGLFNGELGPVPVTTTGSVRGSLNNVERTIEQTRIVGGFRGDLPFLNVGSLDNWSFEAYASYSNGQGTSSRVGIRDDRAALALGWDPTTDLGDPIDLDGDGNPDSDGDGIAEAYGPGDGIVDGQVSSAATDPLGSGGLLLLPGGACDISNLSNPGLLQPDAAEGCIPINLFTDAFYQAPNGDLTAAERAYLFDSRDFDTTYEQTVFNVFASGDVLELPAGPVIFGIGAEYRIDELNSKPDNVASLGLFTGFFSDLGAAGEKWTREAFAEVDIPILGNKPFARELGVQASARWTEDEFFGSGWSYSVKAGWRPFDPLLLKASFGTSFRAPNLRENFIRGTSGFNTVADPCAVPEDAIALAGDGTFVYDPNGDDRIGENPQIFETCRREGRDPESVGVNFASGQVLNAAGVEITTGGSAQIGPETSESFTAGLAFEQPWFDAFDLNLNVNYYDIEINDTIIQPGNQFIVNDCFLRDDGIRSPFCDRLETGGAFGLLTDINATFENQDVETVAGLDYNATLLYDFDFKDQPMTFRLNLRANKLNERSTIFIGNNLQPALDEDVGEFGFPEWTGFGTASLDVADYRFTWETRFIGEVEQPEAGIEPFADVTGNNASDTCLGPEFGDELCRNVGFADDYFVHTASIRYQGDDFGITFGATNIFDRDPPLVDGAEVFSVSNVPIGVGYDIDGRQYFLQVFKDF